MKRLLLSFALAISYPAMAQQTAHDNLMESIGGAESGTAAINDIENDLYTGQLKVSMPLFSYKNPNSGLEHSIKASFDGSGIKLSDLSGDIGIKWSLNTGGWLAREVRGLPDEVSGGFRMQPPVPLGVNSNDTSVCSPYTRDVLDGEFDIYHYSIAGIYGKFVIGKDGSIRNLTPANNVTIIDHEDAGYVKSSLMDSCVSRTFELWDPKGFRYYFGVYNCEQLTYASGKKYASTLWYLTRIEDPLASDSVVFSYEKRYSENIGVRSAVRYDLDASTNYSSFPGGKYICSRMYERSYKAKVMRLKTVCYLSGDTVRLDYDPFYRLDMPTDYALASISKTRNGQGTGYRFGYSYAYRYNASDTATFTPGTTVPDLEYQDYSNIQGYAPNNIRAEAYNLQLNRVQLYNLAGDTLPYYKFQYDPMSLPERFSQYGVDLFGYYNGQNIQGPFPEVTFLNNAVKNFTGSPRLPDLNYAKARSLSSLTLPTGGVVSFEYGLHTNHSPATENTRTLSTYGEVSGLQLKSITQYDGISHKNDIRKEYRYVKEDGVTSSGVMANSPNNSLYYHEFYGNIWADSNTYILKLCSGSLPDYGYAVDFYSTWLARTTDPLNYVVQTKGNLVGYGRVEEYLGTPSHYTNKKVYEFITAEDYPVPPALMCNTAPYPYIPDLDYAWGLPTSISEYTSSNLLQKKMVLDYDVFTDSLNDANFRGERFSRNAQGPQAMFNPQNRFIYRLFYPVFGRAFLSRSTETNYYPGGNMNIVRDFTYDMDHNTLLSAKVRNAQNELVEFRYYYPFHFGRIPFNDYFQTSLNTIPLRVEKWLNRNNGTKQLTEVTVNNFEVRKTADYKYAPDVVVTPSVWGAFDSLSILQQPSLFVKKASYRYDGLGKLIETQTPLNLSGILYGYREFYPVAAVTNCSTAKVRYTSFEEDNHHGWMLNPGLGSLIPNDGISGSGCYQMTGGASLTASNLDPAQNYRLTYWTNGAPASITANGSAVSSVQLSQHKAWTLYEANVGSTNSISIGYAGILRIDEVRLYPQEAMMTTTTYNPIFGKTSECDENNRIIYYEYDGFGRLQYVRDMDGNIVQAFQYKVQEPQY